MELILVMAILLVVATFSVPVVHTHVFAEMQLKRQPDWYGLRWAGPGESDQDRRNSRGLLPARFFLDGSWHRLPMRPNKSALPPVRLRNRKNAIQVRSFPMTCCPGASSLRPVKPRRRPRLRRPSLISGRVFKRQTGLVLSRWNIAGRTHLSGKRQKRLAANRTSRVDRNGDVIQS